MKIIFALALLTLISCMKRPDHKPDFGPETSLEEIQKVVDLDMPLELEKIKKGQTVSLEIYRVIDVRPPSSLLTRVDEVTAQSEDEGTYRWDFGVTLKERNSSGEWLTSFQPYNGLCWEKIADSGACSVAAALKSTASASALHLMKTYTLKGMAEERDTAKQKITYHNLKREDGILEDCGGIQNCSKSLRYVRISLDQVVWESEERGNRTNISMTFSPDIPNYVNDWLPGSASFTNQLQKCVQSWIEVPNDQGSTQLVPVRDCMEVTGFQFGTL